MRWDPDRYLEFPEARRRPAEDLIARIEGDPTQVWDLGCGTGLVTELLARRWPDAAVHGLDTSPEMLAVARRHGGIDWVLGDLTTWEPEVPADVVTASAVLQWVDGHLDLLPRLMGHTRVLAVQMPRNFDAPSHTILAETAADPPWSGRVGDLRRLAPVATADEYYDALAPVAGRVDLWETEYMHVLTGDDPVARWVAATAARPYLDALGGDGEAFLADYAGRVASAYPRRPDGTTLFPFRRIFFIAHGRDAGH
jgi:trans-aconitate 2-methyltransferase